jgi:hypothetical protein
MIVTGFSLQHAGPKQQPGPVEHNIMEWLGYLTKTFCFIFGTTVGELYIRRLNDNWSSIGRRACISCAETLIDQLLQGSVGGGQ